VTKPSPIRYLLPTATDLIFIILLLVAAIPLSSRLLGDAGTGWHIRNGELILQNHAITRTDPFSATVGGQPWYAWEWLYDVKIASIHDTLGLRGVVLFTAFVIALTFSLLMHISLKRGASLPVAVIFTLLAVCASMIHLLARPHVLSWLFVLIFFWILESQSEYPKRLYALPALMLLWVNLHGGFVVGFVLLVLYLSGAMIEKEIGGASRLAVSGALCFLASFVNPYGYHLHQHVYAYLTDRFLMDHIDEFRSPDFHGVAQQCFVALLLLTMVAVAVRREKISVTHVLVLLFAVYSGLFASRNLPISSILLTLTAAPVLSTAMASSMVTKRWCEFSERMTRVEMAARGHFLPIAVSVALLLACAQGSAIHAMFPSQRFPVAAVDYLQTHRITDPIFCPDDWGGYLIYRLYPQTKVVVDDRHDLHGDEFMKKYLRTIHVEPAWNQLLKENKVRWALLPQRSPLASMLQIGGAWKVQYQDEVSILLENSSQH
jgi:hypothetical protein